MIAVILAGGKGTRLSEFTKDIPKPLIELCGKPVLEYQITNLRNSGINEIILVIGYLGDKIKEYFGTGEKFGVKIRYFEETLPLGTAGALYYLKNELTDNFILIYGDVLCDIDFSRFYKYHIQKGNSLCTLSVHPNNHPFDSDLVVLDSNDVVKEIIRKNEKRDYYYNNCVNAGVFIVSKDIVSYIEENKKQDFEKDIILKLIDNNRIYGYRTTEYIKDMGTPDRFLLVQEHIKNGVVNKKNLANPQKAIFLDRDGTINKHVGLVYKEEQLVIEDDVYEALKIVNNSEYISIVITNQPVVARNLCSIEQLENIHKKMETLFGEKGVYVDDIYYCPHHPDKGYPEENKDYKIECNCRKPKIGMIQEAMAEYNIDLSNSYFIGDTTIDIQTGINAGLKTILLATGEGGKDKKFNVESDYNFPSLLDAVKHIVN
jgi:D,D-heptose 1,7-bisphosphate phosphatase